MNTKQLVLIGGAVGAALTVAVAQEKAGSSSNRVAAPPPSAPAVSDYPIIGYIEKRGRIITIKAGPKGPLYSVKTSEGKLLFEHVSAEQLRAQAPELREFLKSAVAGASGKAPVADARIWAER